MAHPNIEIQELKQEVKELAQKIELLSNIVVDLSLQLKEINRSSSPEVYRGSNYGFGNDKFTGE